MLVLQRKKNESVILEVGGELIAVSVVEICNRSGEPRVRLGFTASNNVAINREEVYERIQHRKESRP